MNEKNSRAKVGYRLNARAGNGGAEALRALRRTWNLIRMNWKPMVVFELFYKAAVAVAFTLLPGFGIKLVLRAMGLSYVTRENVRAVILNPLTGLLAVALITLAVACVMIDISAVVYILDCSVHRVRCRKRHILRFAVRSALRAGRPANFPLLLVLLLLSPLMSLGMACGLLATLSPPEFLKESFRMYPYLYAAGLALMLLLAFAMTRRLYTFHYFALEGCDFREAAGRSAALGSGRLADYGVMLLVQAAFAVLMVLVILALTLLAAGLGRALDLAFHRQWLANTVIWYSVMLSLGIVLAFSAPISFGCISQLFYKHKLESGEAVVPVRVPVERADPLREKILKALKAALMALVVSGVLAAGCLIHAGALNPPIEDIHTMEITAHRGASASFPENTMAAFRGAWELGADWVELDVQQTLDGQIVVMHDADTRRTTGVRGKVWNMTYEQVSRLDAGSSFSRAFAGEPIPLLTEVAEYARDTGLRLNIELKPTGHETDFEKAVIDIVREYGIEDRCVITSQVYDVLTRVKAYDARITTVYVTSLAYGDIDRLAAADHFSVRSTSVTRRLVSRVHNQGRQIYAWTVNTSSAIDRMIERGVDNIITDDIGLARQRVLESRYSPMLSDLVQTLQADQDADRPGESAGDDIP